jgi:guanylate kinase
MGQHNSGKSSVKKTLESLGFKKLNTYTTKGDTQEEVEELERHGYIHITNETFKRHVDSGHIIEAEEYNGELYGIARPIAAKKYVVTVNPYGLDKLREIYGRQVIGIYLKCDKETLESRENTNKRLPKNSYNMTEQEAYDMETKSDVVIDSSQDFLKVKLDLMTAIRELSLEE